jgi:hypothetical protein
LNLFTGVRLERRVVFWGQAQMREKRKAMREGSAQSSPRPHLLVEANSSSFRPQPLEAKAAQAIQKTQFNQLRKNCQLGNILSRELFIWLVTTAL